jgi:hypothetical protein
VLLPALCAAGCGGARAAPPVASPGTMRFVAAAPPAPATPGRGPVNLVFVTPRRGFVATTGGLRDVARVGWVLPSAPGEIERSRDGGATWRSLWRGRLSFDALAVRRRLIVASGMRARETGRHDAWFTTFRRHTLLVSRDGGRTWGRRSLPIRGTVALQILAPRSWLAFRAHEPFGESGSALLRSDDAGRHWYRVPVPRGTQALRFATPLVAVASADARSCRGRQRDEFGFRMQLWRTTDGGWQRGQPAALRRVAPQHRRRRHVDDRRPRPQAHAVPRALQRSPARHARRGGGTALVATDPDSVGHDDRRRPHVDAARASRGGRRRPAGDGRA